MADPRTLLPTTYGTPTLERDYFDPPIKSTQERQQLIEKQKIGHINSATTSYDALKALAQQSKQEVEQRRKGGAYVRLANPDTLIEQISHHLAQAGLTTKELDPASGKSAEKIKEE